MSPSAGRDSCNLASSQGSGLFRNWVEQCMLLFVFLSLHVISCDLLSCKMSIAFRSVLENDKVYLLMLL